jgi:signal peptide peptidase SppA
MKGEILAIESGAYERMREVLELHARGVRFTIDEAAGHAGLVARPPGPTRQSTPTGGTIAIIPLMGFMSYRPGLFSLVFGGTSTAQFTAEIRRAGADTSISTIFIPSDSPGGSVDGVEEAAAAVAEAARQKRVVAIADVMAASAAYWAISNASEIVASPSARVGSIGALAIHDDLTKALEQAGIRRTFVTSSAFKAEGNEAEVLSPEARTHIQSVVNSFDAMMTSRIAGGRRVTAERVRSEYGQGRVVLAQDALRRGMVDRVAALAETLDRISAGGPRPGGSFAASADADLDLRRRRHSLAVLTPPPPFVADDDVAQRRRRHALAELTRTPTSGRSAAEADLDARRRRHRLAEARRR